MFDNLCDHYELCKEHSGGYIEHFFYKTRDPFYTVFFHMCGIVSVTGS